MTDPWLPDRWRRLSALVRAEQRLYRTYLDVLDDWLTRVRNFVLGNRRVDPVGVFTAAPAFVRAVDDVVITEVRRTVDDAHFQVAGDDWEPDAHSHVARHILGARNRLVGVPNGVYGQIRDMTMKATSEGWSIQDLASEVEEILGDSGIASWRNRALTVARTEAISAYNAGTHAGYLSVAGQLGGIWEKMWLATLDERTRRTHAHATGADLQRVPLSEPFKVGRAALMYPGDPSGPPEEVINCRCSTILLREGEKFDAGNRWSKLPGGRS